MKRIITAFTGLVALGLAGCSLFGSDEAVKQDSSRTVYRAAEPAPDLPGGVPMQQEVPGEKRSKLF